MLAGVDLVDAEVRCDDRARLGTRVVGGQGNAMRAGVRQVVGMRHGRITCR